MISTVKDQVVRRGRAVNDCKAEEMEVGLRDDRFREILRLMLLNAQRIRYMTSCFLLL